MKNQFDTAFGMYKLYPTYDELVAKQKEYLGRLWDYELPTDAIILEDPVVVLLAEGTGPIKKRSKLLKTNKLICAYRGSVNISPMNKITAKKQKLKIKQLQ